MCKEVDEEPSSHHHHHHHHHHERPSKPESEEGSESEEIKEKEAQPQEDPESPLVKINMQKPEWEEPKPTLEPPVATIYGNSEINVTREDMSSTDGESSGSSLVAKEIPDTCDSSVDEFIDRLPFK